MEPEITNESKNDPGAENCVESKPAKERWSRQEKNSLLLALLALAGLLWYARPRSFAAVMDGLDFTAPITCEVEYQLPYQDGVASEDSVLTATLSETETAELIALLDSTGYRKQFSNIVAGGALGSYSYYPPVADISFIQTEWEDGKRYDNHYQISMLGRDIPAGAMGEKCDYSAWSGRNFQKKVNDWVADHCQQAE